MKALAASRSTELGYCPGNYDSLDLRPRRLGRSIEEQRVGRNRGGARYPTRRDNAGAIVSSLRNALNIN